MKGRFLQLMRKQWIIYAGVFVITVFLALILLIGCAILPQNQINEHVLDSISTITRDIREDYIISDHSKGSMLDVATDSLMIHASVGTNSRYLGSVLTNPIYGYSDLPDWRDRDEVLTRLSYDMPHDTVWFYARYWMGFRVLLRLALTFLLIIRLSDIWHLFFSPLSQWQSAQWPKIPMPERRFCLHLV